MVKDLGSVHGTWLNGRKIVPHVLQHLEAGDSLIFGQNVPHASRKCQGSKMTDRVLTI